MNKKYIYKEIIECIKTGKSFSVLADRKYTYGQIASFVVQAVNDGYIEYGNDGFYITKKGEAFQTMNIITHYNERMVNYCRADTLSIDEVYVPKYNEGRKRKKEN